MLKNVLVVSMVIKLAGAIRISSITYSLLFQNKSLSCSNSPILDLFIKAKDILHMLILSVRYYVQEIGESINNTELFADVCNVLDIFSMLFLKFFSSQSRSRNELFLFFSVIFELSL